MSPIPLRFFFTLFPLLALAPSAPAQPHSSRTDFMTSPSSTSTTTPAAAWIWTSSSDPAPVNRFTWFRREIQLAELPADATLLFAADSTARLLINGQVVRRKVARYHEPEITAEVVNAGPYLKPGRNVVTVLHHNWGPVITFQRTANAHAGLLLAGEWISTDSSWKWTTAPQFLQHEEQIIGVAGGAPRIRFPVVMDGRADLAGDINSPGFDDSAWPQAVVVSDAPWDKTPPDRVETPGQREYPALPLTALAAGRLETRGATTTAPKAIADSIRQAHVQPDAQLTSAALDFIAGSPFVLRGRAGESRYVTFDFARPVHGYPLLHIAGATSGTMVDFGYAEIALSLHTGELHVREDGWIDPTGVVGSGYADRYIARDGAQTAEIPEERTARWLTLHVHFLRDGELVLDKVGIIKSQFPINPVGSFQCGDPVIDQIVRLCVDHAEVTMTDAYVDTPGREDGQWIEDAQLRASIAERWFADTTLRRLLLRTHAQSQGPDGHTHPFAPSNYPAYPATYDWSIQWVATLWDEYMWSGDTDLVRHYWPVLTRYWENVLARVNEEGLWQTPAVLADIRVGVHADKPHQSSGMVTPVVIERLKWSARLAEAIGETIQSEAWNRAAEKMAEAFRRHHVIAARENVPAHVGDIFDPQDPAVARGFSQASQLAASYTGLLSPEQARQVLEYTFPAPEGTPPAGVTRWNNPTHVYRALKALTTAGMPERAVSHLKERYLPYLPASPSNPLSLRLQGPFGGPLPEYWVSREDLGLKPGELNPAQPEDPTGSHGWGAVPLYWLHEHLLGVTLTAPGGARIRIAPETGGLPFVSGWTNTPKGPVYVYYDPQQWTVEAVLPAGVTADLVRPAPFAGKRVELVQEAGGAEKNVAESIGVTGPGRFYLRCY